jgi:hypothetical protein
VLPFIESPWPIEGTPNLAVDSLIASNSAGMAAYRSQIQFQPENAMVIAGPIRGPTNTGTVRIVPLAGFTDVTDPAIDPAGNVYFGGRGADFVSRLYVILPTANAPAVYASHWNFLETILSVAVDSSCMQAAPGAACTIAVLYEREVGPAVPRFVWAADLFLDIAPAVAGPFPPWIISLDSAAGEVSVVECNPNDVGSGRVLSVIAQYQVIDPPRVTFEAEVQAAHVNRGQNFCGVRALPHYPGGACPDPHGGTTGAMFMAGQACAGAPTIRLGFNVPNLGLMATNPRAINNRGDIAFSATQFDGSSGLFYHPNLRTICTGDSDCDLVVGFGDIAATLANWGTAFPPGGFCVPMGDSNSDRVVTFADITATLDAWGRDCR